MRREHEPTHRRIEATVAIRPARPRPRPLKWENEGVTSLIEQPKAVRPARPKALRAGATRGFAERLALFVSGVDRAHTDELLEGLAGVTQRRATAFAREAREWDSATRQGRMAVTFGNHPHAADRLKQLMHVASPAMRGAIFGRLAPWQRSLFPQLEGAATCAVAPAMDALAERLIREATR